MHFATTLLLASAASVSASANILALWDIDITSSSCTFTPSSNLDGEIVSVQYQSKDTMYEDRGLELELVHASSRCANYKQTYYPYDWTRDMKGAILTEQQCITKVRNAGATHVSRDSAGRCWFTPDDGVSSTHYGHKHGTSTWYGDCKREGWGGWNIYEIVPVIVPVPRTTGNVETGPFTITKSFPEQMSGVTTVKTVVRHDNDLLTYREVYENGVPKVSTVEVDASSIDTAAGIPECHGKWARPALAPVPDTDSCSGSDCSIQGQRCVKGSEELCCGFEAFSTNLQWVATPAGTPCNVPRQPDGPFKCITADGTTWTYSSSCAGETSHSSSSGSVGWTDW